MRDDELNRILGSRDDDIVPASGFADAVMEAVRRELAVPAPIPFPWKRALPGIAAGAAALVFLVVAVIWWLPSHAAVFTLSPATVKALTGPDAGWVLLAGLLTVASLAITRRIARN
jgi:ABC-type amino acid transport substrate-binding protein